MRTRRSFVRRSRNGVARIQRASYNTVAGNIDIKHSWYALRDQCEKRAGGKCEARGCSRAGSEAHHITPLSRGGTNTLRNLIYLCKTCHKSRHNHMYRR